jgi:4-amino-4-deoxy-L-arabinose transferase-like glycosyltransferase
MKTLDGNTIAVFGLLIVFCFSIYFFSKNKTSAGLILLMAGAFLLRIFVYSADPFLYDWDERFHALVAKNMSSDPFKPVLQIDPVLPYDYKDWSNNYVWLHKQPLFLWLIAISIKIFGATEFALRLPSALMGSVLAFFAYRTGRNCFGDIRVAVFAAFLLAFSFYQIELGAGRLPIDHNDVSFCFFVTASAWALSEYYRKNRLKWALWVGIFSGAAILCKWLTGGIVYAGWIIMLVSAGKKPTSEQLKHFLIAGITTLAIFLPWQIYTVIRFPLESSYEREMVAKHLTEAVEGHEHGMFFYFDEMRHHYGRLLIPFLITGLIVMTTMKENRRLKWALIGMYVICFLFFSLVPKTKLWSFTFVVAPIGFIMIAAGIISAFNFINRYLKLGNAILYSSLLLFSVICLKPWEMIRSRQHDPLRTAKAHNTEIYKSIPDSLANAKTVLFNCKGYEDIDVMYFKNINAYAFYPSEEELNMLLNKGFKIYAFNDHHDQVLPSFMRNNAAVKIINADIW